MQLYITCRSEAMLVNCELIHWLYVFVLIYNLQDLVLLSSRHLLLFLKFDFDRSSERIMID